MLITTNVRGTAKRAGGAASSVAVGRWQSPALRPLLLALSSLLFPIRALLPPLPHADAHFHVADCTNELYAGKLPQDGGRTLQLGQH